MTAQLDVLFRIKELKREQAFRSLLAKQAEAEAARLAADEAREVVAQSAATLPHRQDAVYAEILGEIIDLTRLEATKGRAQSLESDHAALKDARDRAEHISLRIGKELDAAAETHRLSLKARDKYEILTTQARQENEALAALKEEGEIEDLFARAREKFA